MTANPALVLEILNGAGMVIELCFILYMVRYLYNEAIRRRSLLKDLLTFNLPPSMNFAMSVVVFDIGVWSRSVTVWEWRRYEGAGPFNNYELAALAFGAALIVWGALCKIRSVTRPDYGHGPWVSAASLTLIFVVFELVWR